MALPAAIQAIVTRFRGTNNNAYNAANNPLGMGQGGQRQNFPPRLKDMADALHFVADQTDLSSANVEATAADVLLTAEDAENTRLDRIATAENVGLAADEVGKAAAQANRSRDEADRAAGFAAGVKLPGIGVADRLKFLRAKADGSGNEYADAGVMPRRARNSNVQIAKSDVGALIDITAGTFTQTFASPADLGDGFYCYVRQGGTGDVTIPASDERTNWIMYSGEVRIFQCDGVTLRSIVLAPFSRIWTASANFIKPPGYPDFDVEWLSGGAGGGTATSGTGQGGGGGGGWFGDRVAAASIANSSVLTVGAGGAPNADGGATEAFGARVQGGNSSQSIGGFVFGASFLGPVIRAVAQEGSYFGGGGGVSNGSTNASAAAGGASVFGGGGGGGRGGGAGGTSVRAGNGGAANQNGQVPAGGGGHMASGARGEIRIRGVA